MAIHPSAVIDKKAVVDPSAEVGPFSMIGPGVRLAANVKVQNNVVIEGNTEIGEGTQIFPFACIGMPPQDLKYKGEETGLRVGKNCIIREYATVHRASIGGDKLTGVGDNCFLMAYTHVAHDCKLGSHVIIANATMLAGHVLIEDHAFIGGLVAVHQFTRIGAYAMVGGLSGIGQDIPPYMMASGPRAQLYGLNLVGLKRGGFSDETIEELKKAYKIIFRDKHTLKAALKKVQEEVAFSDEIKHLIDFINDNKRGICRP